MPYQFDHVEVFARRGAHLKNSCARKASMFDIQDEMVRAPHACSHVADPQPPNIVFGMHPSAAFALANDRASEAVDKIGRRLRWDAPVVLVGIVSFPALTAEVLSDPEAHDRYARWRAANIAWLQALWGDRLMSVVEHIDEQRPHLHYVVVPALDPNRRLRIESVHAGYRASTECREAGGKPREQKKAYQAAMQRFQDDYHFQVGVRFGLTRVGPRRQRLTRAEWRERQREAERLAEDYARLEHHYSNIRAKAREYVAEKAAVTEAAAQSKIDDIVMQSRHDMMMLKQETNKRIAILRGRESALRNELEEKDALINAQEERLAQALERLAVYEGGFGPEVER